MPDLNSVPASPHVLAHSRRESSQDVNSVSASATDSSLNILPSNQDTVNHPTTTSSDTVPQAPPAQHVQTQQPPADAAVGPGPGPLRHPRPLTATELHMELEKEQEAVVSNNTCEDN